MSLYLLIRDEWSWDEDEAAVIRAESELEARQIAEAELDPKDEWLRPTTTCVQIVPHGESGVILKASKPG